MKKINIILWSLIALIPLRSYTQDAGEIIRKADEKFRGNTSYSEFSITIVRPRWSKEVRLKSWSKGSDYSVSVVTYPAKEKGIVFLKRKKEVWNYLPSIGRKVKLPPSMLLQSWMGTDLTNDDIIKQSSIASDYEHKIIGEEELQGLKCWKIELKPKEDAVVVWGKITIWIDQKDYMQMKVEFYDEDGFLVNSMIGYDPKMFGNKKMPSKYEIIPWEKEGNKTIIEYKKIDFDIPVNDQYFSINYMEKLK